MALEAEIGLLEAEIDLIASSILTKYSGSVRFTTHLDHMSHCKIILVIVWYKFVEQMDPPSILSAYSPRLDQRSEREPTGYEAFHLHAPHTLGHARGSAACEDMRWRWF
jgi:hypothetical protein